MRPIEDVPRVGLARALSKLGFCSRSAASQLIFSGRVRVNGATRRDPEARVRLGHDRIEVDQRPVESGTKLYLMLNKPRGLVTTVSDEKGRETIYSCLGADLPWIFPVGRLDKASEGLLLLTNDTGWGQRIANPETHLDKTYHVQISGPVQPEFVRELVQGMRSNGDILRARSAGILRQGNRNTWLTIVLDEGKNRQIRRMMESRGVEVLRLVRVAIGPLPLGNLAKGTYRVLTREEKLSLDRAIGHR